MTRTATSTPLTAIAGTTTNTITIMTMDPIMTMITNTNTIMAGMTITIMGTKAGC